MSSLSKFLGLPKEIEINGEKITLHPLKVKDINKFSKLDTTDEEKAKIARDLILLSIPDTTEDEVNTLPIEIFTKIIEEINKLNGFVDENMDKIRLERKLRQSGGKSEK